MGSKFLWALFIKVDFILYSNFSKVPIVKIKFTMGSKFSKAFFVKSILSWVLSSRKHILVNLRVSKDTVVCCISFIF